MQKTKHLSLPPTERELFPMAPTVRDAGFLKHRLKGLVDFGKGRPVRRAPLPACNDRRQCLNTFGKTLTFLHMCTDADTHTHTIQGRPFLFPTSLLVTMIHSWVCMCKINFL